MFPRVERLPFTIHWGFSKMRQIKIAVFVIILGSFVISCGRANGSDQPKAAGRNVKAADPDAKFYSFTLSPTAINTGEKTTVTVTVVPATGYKWNEDYPAKFTVSSDGDLTLSATEFKSKRKDIVKKGKEATFALDLVAATAGNHPLTIEGGFSVCNATSCKIFRKKVINLNLDVN